MQENPMPEDQSGEGWITPDQEDAAWQGKLVSLLLEEYPEQLSKSEVARELLKADPDFSERDALDRAIRDLGNIGVLQCSGPLVLLTRPIRYFTSLELD